MPLSLFLLGPKEYGLLETGATGLAIKMVFMQFIAVNIQLWFNTKYLKIPFLKFLFHQFIVVSIFVAFATGCSQIVASLFLKVHFIAQFLISGILYTAVILCFVWLFPWLGALKKNEISALYVIIINKLLANFRQET